MLLCQVATFIALIYLLRFFRIKNMNIIFILKQSSLNIFPLDILLAKPLDRSRLVSRESTIRRFNPADRGIMIGLRSRARTYLTRMQFHSQRAPFFRNGRPRLMAI